MQSSLNLRAIPSIVGVLFGLGWVLVPTPSLARPHEYPVNSRAVFLTGCLLEDPPNFQSEREVNNLMEVCVCMLDNFQENYTNLEFLRLFSRAEKGEQPYKDELDEFAEEHFYECL